MKGFSPECAAGLEAQTKKVTDAIANGATNIIVNWKPTKTVEVKVNTKKRFVATLHDDIGTYEARVIRHRNTVTVDLEGIPTSRNISLEYARWNWDMIWNRLAAEGHPVKALGY